LEQAVRRVLLHGIYEPEPERALRGNAFDGMLEGKLTADELLKRYCAHAVRLFGTRAAAARNLALDVRTLQKYIGSEQN
jgi:hypothetical protein